jgi:hypothetical protein
MTSFINFNGKNQPLVNAPPETDNVWEVDCSSFFPPNVNGMDIHGAYFVTDGTIQLMRQVLHGLDRSVLHKLSVTRGNA